MDNIQESSHTVLSPSVFPAQPRYTYASVINSCMVFFGAQIDQAESLEYPQKTTFSSLPF